MIAVESASYGNTASNFGTVQRDGRSNYTTPYDNIHYAWDAVNQRWYTVPASGRNWIGTYSVTSADQQVVKGGGNLGSITLVPGSGGTQFLFKFAVAMPNPNYCVVVQTAGGSPTVPRNDRTTTQFLISTPANPATLDVAVFA